MTDTTNTPADSDLAGAADKALHDNGISNQDTNNDKAASDQASDKTGADNAADKKNRPDYIDEQFWDGDKGEVRLEALAKSNRDLREKVSRGLKEPAPPKPENYEFKADEGVTLDANDKGLSLARTVAHRAGMSQTQFNVFVNEFMKTAPSMVADWAKEKNREPTADEKKAANDAELLKLSNDKVEAQNFVNNVVSFFKGKVDQGSLDTNDYKALMRMGGDADGIRALSKIISVVYNVQNIPRGNAVETEDYTMDQFYKDVEDPQYASDESFRKSCQARLEKIVGKGNAPPPRGFGLPAGSSFKLPNVDKKSA